jgi:hypothetical protein
VAADVMTWTSLSLVICAQLTGRGATIRRSIAAAVILYLPSLLVKEQALAAFAGVSVIACLATVTSNRLGHLQARPVGRDGGRRSVERDLCRVAVASWSAV